MSKQGILIILFVCKGILLSGQQSSQEIATPKAIKMLLDQGKLIEARSQILKMPKEAQSSPESLELIGDIYFGLKRWDSALIYYERFKDIDPKNPAGPFKYGGALGMKALSKNKFTALMYLDDIKASFQKSVDLDPTYVAAHWALIEYYFQVPSFMGGGVERAMQQADALYAVSPVDGLMARARVAEEDEDLGAAEQNYRQAVDTGQSLWAYKELISFYERHKRWDSAFDQLKTAMTKFDDLSLNYQWAKMSVLSDKYVTQGRNYIAECLGPTAQVEGIPEQWIRLRYAQLLRKTGQNKTALEQVNLALVLDANFEQAKEEQRILQKILNTIK